MSLEEENKIIDEAYEKLINGYLSSKHRKKVEKIDKAFRFARRAHEGIRRRSGEPYILHPIAVATIVSQEIGLGSTSICAALLHDVVEDTEYTLDDIKSIFGDELVGETGEKVGDKIANIVEGLTKISGGIFGDKASAQAENFKKLLLTMSDDIRVILIKMADRLHNMRTLASMPAAKQYKIAGETLYIYAPLAHRLGLFAIKTELEDLSFKYEHPDIYKAISEDIAAGESKRQDLFDRFSLPIRKRLDAMGLEYEFKARVKSCYSIWKKMQAKRIPLNEIYDIYAARIVFECPEGKDENVVCWSIYNQITKIYNKIHPDRIRDWLAHAKPNGYRALHVTVMGPDGDWVEVQIRSRKMDNIDERGVTAHWVYKEGGEMEEDSQLRGWLQEIEDILKNPEPNALDFLDSIKLNLYAREITVFTPKGDMISLPMGASVLDLAFTLHSEIGTHCIAAKVNHRLVPLSHRLSSGDQVEILTSQSQRPQHEWSKWVVTAKGKTRLNNAFRHIRREVVDKGEATFKEFMAENNAEINNENLTRIISSLGVQNKEDLFFKVGKGDIELTPLVFKALKPASQNLLSKWWKMSFGSKNDKNEKEQSDEKSSSKKIDRKKVYVLRTENGTSNYQLANCCHPLPGDDVLGYIDANNKVIVHKIDCPTAMKLKSGYGSRLLETQWEIGNETFFASIRVEGIDRMGILQEIIYLISTNLSINIRRLNITSNAGVFTCEMDVLVEDVNTVTKMCKRLGKVKGVSKAIRRS